ncbi:MAG: C10 family peptidase [Lentimicrobiaceae bacterium]|nr:C10 family peptidase [Lentimicrobiaceae bacterium]
MKRIFLFLFSCIFLNTHAINEEQALLVAQNFLQEKKIDQNSSLSHISLQEVVVKEGKPIFYIMNLGNKEGFVIVAASEFATPVIGYSFENEFQWHLAIQHYFDSFSNAILLEEKSKNTPDVLVTKQWNYYLQEIFVSKTVILREVPVLVTSRWNQDKFYNTYCPWDVKAGPFNDYRTYNGCVALAAAQLMNYYRHPETGRSGKSYKPSSYPIQTVFFSQHNYHWDAMSDFATAYTNEIAKLTYHLGVSCDMGYGVTGSGTQTEKVTQALYDYFYYTQYSIGDGNKPGVLKSELDLLQPILMSGANSESGHAYLVDGYYEFTIDTVPGGIDSKFHFNWGWGGFSDGYFLLKEQSFPSGATAFLNLKPATNYPVQCQQGKRQTAFQGYITNGSTNMPYQSNPDCSWMIAASGAKQYSFSFSRLDTEEGVDVITIYNGSTKSSGVAATYSGTTKPEKTITVVADSVLITFTSNNPAFENATHLGFLISYTANKPQQKCDMTSYLSAASGYITDGSAQGEDYTPWVSCTWNITPPNGNGFYGLFHEFDLKLGDFVDVYDATKSPPHLWRRFDRYTPPTKGEVLHIPFSKIQLRFITDNFQEGNGFKFQYYSLLGVNDHSLLDNLTIYPNPASDFINLSFSSELTNQSISCRIFDLAGKEVYATVIDYTSDRFEMQIPVTHLSKGFYFLQLVTPTGISTSKIIID